MTDVTPEEVEAEVPAVEKKPAPKSRKKKPALDKSQPYGVVYGAGPTRFYQDGCFFDIRGEQVDP